jgi:pentalenic acid synthase
VWASLIGVEVSEDRQMTDTVAFPQNRTCPYQPAPGYRPLAEQRPLSRITLFDGREAWAVTGDALTRRLLCDPRISSDRTDPAWPVASAMAATARDFSDAQKANINRLTALVGTDGLEHDTLREVVEAGFTTGLIDSVRPRIQEIADRQLDDMVSRGAPADLVRAFTMPMPLAALYETLGIPREDHGFFKEKAQQVMVGPDAGAAYGELAGYLAALIATRQRKPDESLLDTLLAAREPDAEAMLQMLLIVVVSGHHLTSGSIALGAYTLLQHPERLAELRADPSLMPAAVDELTRLVAVPDGLQRVAAADIDVEGTTIGKGDGVFFLFSLINRDEETYERPESLDWQRPSLRDHLTYGFGPHRCVGRDLARAIMEIAFRTLLERLPGLRLAVPAEEIPVNPGEALQGLSTLPVAW